MTIVEYLDDEHKAIMYDGFIPDKDVSIATINILHVTNAITTNEFNELMHYAKYKRQTINSDIYLYYKLQYYMMTRLDCPDKHHKVPFHTPLCNKINRIHCFSQYYTIGNNRHSLELHSRKYLKQINAAELYAALHKEYSHIKSLNTNNHYVQNVIIHKNNACKGPTECIKSLINMIGFYPIQDDSYIDIYSFKSNWIAVLRNILNKYRPLYFPS